MNETTRLEDADVQLSQPYSQVQNRRKSYATPQLRVYGTIERITGNQGPNTGDGHNGSH